MKHQCQSCGDLKLVNDEILCKYCSCVICTNCIQFHTIFCSSIVNISPTNPEAKEGNKSSQTNNHLEMNYVSVLLGNASGFSLEIENGDEIH